MPELDEYLRNELRRIVRPVDLNDVSSVIDVRRKRRARIRKIQSVALAVVVIAGSLGGVAVLRSAFSETGPRVGSAADMRNGVIVYSEVRNAGQRLWAADPDGSGARQLTSGQGVSDSSPSVSPDGRTVAFERTDGSGSSIFTVGIDGAGLAEFSPGDVSAVAPSWSPDGTLLAYAGGDGGIFVLDVGGSDPRLVVDHTFIVTHLTWSPDGTRIAFAAAPSTANGAQSNYDLWITDVTDVSGSTPVNITSTSDASELSPSWSPDGRQILFSSDPLPGSSLFAMSPDPDASPIAITNGTNVDQNPSWSPDGTRIVFDRTSSGGTDIYTMLADGSDLTLAARNATDPAWQAVPADASSTPSPEPSPPTSPGQAGPGLGFPTCNVSSVTGTFGSPEVQGTAYVATKMGDVTGCPPVDDGFNVIAIDLDGDGVADTDYGPIECELECRVFSAPDLNGDGISELLVVQQGGTVPALGVFAMQTNLGPEGVGPAPVEIAPPGDPGHGFTPNRPAQLFVGGDAGDSAGLSCPTSQGRVLLVQDLGSMVPFDSPDAVWKIHETIFMLGPDGRLHVVSTEDRETPIDAIPFGGSDPFHVRPTFPCTR